MKTTKYMALAIACIMVIVSAPAVLACHDHSCDVVVPECRGCYTMTATASLDHHGAEGTSTILTNAVNMETNIEINHPHGDVYLNVGAAIPGDDVDRETYGYFNLGGKADVEMTSVAVVEGCRNCGANVESTVDVKVGHDGASGVSGATYDAEPAGWFMQSIEITASGGVIGDLKDHHTELSATAQNDFYGGTVESYVYAYHSPDNVGSYAGATFYKLRFCR